MEGALLDLSIDQAPRAAFEKALEPYDVNDKGTIRFPLSQPVPVKLIEGLAKFRAKEVIAERASKTKAAARKR